MERPKESIKEDMSEKQADLLLSQIEKIVKGEKVELALVDDLKTVYNALVKVKDIMDGSLNKAKKAAVKGDTGVKNFYKKFKYYRILFRMSKNNKEPLLTENPNRFVMFPIEHDDIWKSYKQMMDCFWRAEEIDFSKDIAHWVLGRPRS